MFFMDLAFILYFYGILCVYDGRFVHDGSSCRFSNFEEKKCAGLANVLAKSAAESQW